MGSLVFKPIDVDAHGSICVGFRRDSYLCSFGVDGFLDQVGAQGERYIAKLRHGWRDLGLRPGRDDVHLMERAV